MQKFINPETLNKIKAENNFYEFIKQAWPIVDPACFDESAWHLKLLADYFQALSEDKIPTNNLLINIPPRFGKSRVADLFVPWIWIKNPEKKFIYGSYGKELACDATKLIRTVINSSWYQERWPLRLTENRQDYIANYRRGNCYAVGTGGAVTGKGASYLIADDLVKVQQANSDTEIKSANDWYDDTFSNRFDNIKTIKKVVIGQRIRNDDIAGHLLEKNPNGWEHIVLPLEYDGTRYTSSIGLDDPRTEIGQSLWPNRFGAKEIEKVKGDHTELGYATEFMQRTTTIQGCIFKKDWFINRIDNTDIVARFISCDTAQSVKSSADPNAIIVGEIRSDYRLFIRDVSCKRLEFPQLQAEVERLSSMYKYKLKKILIESKSSGISLQQSITQSSPDWMGNLIFPVNPVGDKVQRFYQASMWCEKGTVLLPPPNENFSWLFDFESEFFSVPQSRHDDMSDALSQLILFVEPYLAEALRAYKEGVKQWD